jgi:hypothetical protein
MSETQLTSASGYNTNNMIFSQAQSGAVKDTTIKFRRIPILTKYTDGSVGDLIFPTERLFSFGVCENINPETKKVNGYVFPIVLYDKDGESKAQRDFVDTFNKVIDKCKEYLLSNKKELKLHDLEPADLKKFNPIYYKKTDGEIVDGALPTLYVKLIVSKKDGQEKIVSNFYNMRSGDSMNPLDLLKQYCYTTAAIKIESIFLGKNISIQVKLYEADIELLSSGKKRLLPRPTADTKVSISDEKESKVNPLSSNDDDSFSLNGDDDDNDASSVKSEDEEEPVKPVPKKVVKKVVKKVTK